MAYMGGGGGGWGGGGGNWGGGGMHDRGGQQLRRSVDAWDDEELGSAYNHAVVKRIIGFMGPYKLRAFAAVAGVVLAAVLANIQPNVIGNAIDAASRGDTGA